MIVDFINCLIEFTCVFTFFRTLSNVSLKKKSYFIYGFECILCSLIFVLFETPLLINIPLYLLIPCLAFPFEYKENYIFMIASFLIILYLQFMSFSVIPSTLLQTNLGNLIINLLILLLIFVLRFLSYKYRISETLSPLFLNHKLFLILFFIFFMFLRPILLIKTIDFLDISSRINFHHYFLFYGCFSYILCLSCSFYRSPSGSIVNAQYRYH